MHDLSGRYRLSREEQRRTDAFLDGCRIPPALERSLEDYIVKKTGKPFGDTVVLERLRRAVVAQKDDYWRSPGRRRLTYQKGYSVLGYLAYHFPVYFMQTEYLLRELADSGLLKPETTVIDMGSGPGTVPLAIADFFSRLDDASATIWSVERSEENNEAFRFLSDAFLPRTTNVKLRPPIQADISTIDDPKLPCAPDLIIFSNVINEFESLGPDRQADLVLRFAGRLAPDGAILVIEPAEELASIRLRVISRTLQERGLTLHSPCSFPRGTRCDPSRCWSFTTRPGIHATRLMKALAAGKDSYRYLNTDIKFSYAIFTKDGRVRDPYRVPPRSKVAMLSKLHLHPGRRINVVGAKMSQDLGDGRTHVFRLCDGTAAKPVYAVLPAYHRSGLNEKLISAHYGEILEIRNVLVRFNKRHNAYNLLVSRNTCIAAPEKREPV